MLQEDYQGAVSRVDNLGTQLNSELQRNSVLSASLSSFVLLPLA